MTGFSLPLVMRGFLETYFTPPCRIVGTTAADIGPSRTWTWKSAAAGSSYLLKRGMIIQIGSLFLFFPPFQD